MSINTQSGTRIDEIAEDIYRISTPVAIASGGFSFNQYLILDDQPLLFHTGPRRVFPLTLAALTRVLPPERLRWICASHFEADECGALNEWLAVAPNAEPVGSRIAKTVSVDDVSARPARALADGETLALGRHGVTWFDTPHLPHAWECGLGFEPRTRTLLCGDLFTQGGGAENPPLTERDILGPSEAFRKAMDYFSHTRYARAMLERLAATTPHTLACMHGSAWEGDGAGILRALGEELER